MSLAYCESEEPGLQLPVSLHNLLNLFALKLSFLLFCRFKFIPLLNNALMYFPVTAPTDAGSKPTFSGDPLGIQWAFQRLLLQVGWRDPAILSQWLFHSHVYLGMLRVLHLRASALQCSSYLVKSYTHSLCPLQAGAFGLLLSLVTAKSLSGFPCSAGRSYK